MKIEYKRKKPVLADNSGAILLLTLVMTAILAMFATVSLRNSTTELRFTGEEKSKESFFNMAESGSEISVKIAKIMLAECSNEFNYDNFTETCITDALGEDFMNRLNGVCKPADGNNPAFCLNTFNRGDFYDDDPKSKTDKMDINMIMNDQNIQIDIDPDPEICANSGYGSTSSCIGLEIVSTVTPLVCPGGSGCQKTITIQYKCKFDKQTNSCT